MSSSCLNGIKSPTSGKPVLVCAYPHRTELNAAPPITPMNSRRLMSALTDYCSNLAVRARRLEDGAGVSGEQRHVAWHEVVRGRVVHEGSELPALKLVQVGVCLEQDAGRSADETSPQSMTS